MGKLLKKVFKVLAVLIVIVMVATVCVVNFVNPNQFKGLIESETLKHTGHVLKIQGPLAWRWYPILALEMKNVEVENIAPFTESMLSVKTASADCALASLISGQIMLNVKLEGLTLALQRNANGETNWSELQKRLLDPKAKKSEEKSTRLLLNSLTLAEGHVSFQDAVKDQSYNINHLSLNANNLLKGFIGSATPISLNFDVEAPNKPTITTALSTMWSLKQNPQNMDFKDFNFQAKTSDGKIFNLKGDMKLQDFEQNLLAVGKLETQDLDLNAWFHILDILDLPQLPNIAKLNTSFKYQNTVLEVSSINIALEQSGTLDGNFNLNLDQFSLKTLQTKGELTGKQLFIGKTKVDAIKTSFNAADGILMLSPIDLQMNNIQQNLTLQVNFQGNSPKFTLTQEAKDFEMSHLLALFGIKNKLEGKTSSKINLNATGTTPDEWRKSLNGDLKLIINNGNLYGIDLLKLLKSAQSNVYNLLTALANQQAPNTDATLNSEIEKWNTSGSGNNTTPFNSATATAKITNGLLKNPDLAVVHSEYAINGSGTLNLVNETIQYQASVMLKNNPYPATDQIANYLFQTPLPITIQGSIHDPIIRPDLKSYFNSTFKFTQKQVIDKVVDKTIEKALGKMLKLNKE